MRIIGGRLRGRTIVPPKKLSARPTTDFAKEGLFNILNNHIDFEGLYALDLFAGTGSMGYELMSRGADRVDAVELNPLHHKFIVQTAQRLSLHGLTAIRADAFGFVERAASTSYGLVFADPPYDHDRLHELPDLVMAHGLLAPNGWMVLEHSARYNFGAHANFLDHRAYGSVNFSFFKKNAL